jgi:NADH-quinone oxidoreductase subunit C
MSDENAPGTSKENAEPTGGAQSSAQRSGPDQAAQEAGGATPARAGEPEQAPDLLGSDTSPEGGTRQAPTRPRHGMFGVRGTGDTSGFGGLELPGYVPAPAERPYGGWFDAFVDELGAALAERGVEGAVQQITIDRGEITFYVAPERLLDLCRTLRDDEALRFELCSSVSGVDYGADVARRLHVAYHLLSMTYRRRIRLEVTLDVDDAHVPSIVELYPTADWHERETWDMFGVVFDGHPALTRILMPDDWDGHPQRKDYPLGGIPVEYKGAQIPPPDQRRAYS